MKSLERRLGLTSVVAISMGAMLGSGLFVLPGMATALTGPSVWLAYLVAGLCVLPAALAKAELATAMPVSGGTYVYIELTFGPLAGTIAGLGLWLSLLLKSTFALVGFSAYLFILAPIPLRPMSLGLLAVVLLLNILGVRKVGKFQIVIVAIALVGLTTIALWGAGEFRSELLADSFADGGWGFLAAVSFVYISYAGVTQIAAIAEEVENPTRNLPLGIILSLTIVAVLYGVVTLVLVGNVPAATLHEDLRPIYTLAESVAGPTVGILAAVLGILTMTSMANAGVLASSRFPFAMSRDRLLPPALAWVHRRFLTPVACILLTGVFMALAILFLDVVGIAKLASSFMIVAFMAENVTVVALRETGLRWYQPTYRVPFYPWMQIAGVATGVVLLSMMGWIAVAALLGIAIPGVLLYGSYGRRQTDRIGALRQLGPRQDLLLGASTRDADLAARLPGRAAVVVPLFGHERSPERLVEMGAALADGHRIEVIHLTDIPDQTALVDMLNDDAAVSSLRRRIDAMGRKSGIDAEFFAAVTRDVVHAVHDISLRVHSDWIVLEWRGRSGSDMLHLNPLTWLVQHLSCNLAIFNDAGVRDIRDILALPAPGPHDALVADTAAHVAHTTGARVTLGRFVRSGVTAMERQRSFDYLDQLADLAAGVHGTRIIEGEDLVDAVVAATASYDLLILGAGREHQLGHLLFGTAGDRITRRAACDVLRLRTPRAQVHATVERRPTAAHHARLGDFIDTRVIATGVAPMTKEALFVFLSERFADLLTYVPAREIEDGLWGRERLQNTAVGGGIAFPHATIANAERSYLGMFTSSADLDYRAPDGQPVDVLFVTLGPPSDRHAHLLMLAKLSKVITATDLIARLRHAKTAEAVLASLRECEAAVDRA